MKFIGDVFAKVKTHRKGISVTCPRPSNSLKTYKILLTKDPYNELATEYLAEREREKEQRVTRQFQVKGY